ncbi:MAG: PLP-dependent aminotransferase family protein [Acidimicrobiia bacterium]
MDIFINQNAGVGLSTQIYEEIRSGILEGRLAPGDRLPPSRELAETLGVSRSTVTTAYGHLAAEGFLEGRRGGGTVVSELSVLVAADAPARPVLSPTRRDRAEDAVFDLRPGTPDPRLFPTTEWKRYTRWAVDRHLAIYGDPAGLPDLRLVLARWIGRSRGIAAGFRQLVVTSGAQQAFYLLTATSITPGDVVAMEDPGYRRFRRLAEACGANVVPVPVDEEGIVVADIPSEARLVCVTPSHQFPTGVTMSLPRRLALLELAAQHGMVVVEDDYDSEFRYTDRPLEPLYRLDRTRTVAYVASFSKTLSPALRLGYMVVPPGLLSRVLELRQHMDWSPAHIEQEALRAYIADGALDRHLRRTRRIYERRHALLTAFLRRTAAAGLMYPMASNAGLHVCGRLDEQVDESQLCLALASRGVAAEGLAGYTTGSVKIAGLVLGFGRVDTVQIPEALDIVGSELGLDK